MKKKLRILYAAGPGDVIDTYNYWKKQQYDPSVLWKTDSAQFYDLVEEVDAEALVVSYCQRVDTIKEGRFTILQRPKKQFKGMGYHLYQLWYGYKICYLAIKFKANIAIIEEGMSHWFVFNCLHWFGIKIIPSLKSVLWPYHLPLSSTQKILNFLNRSLFKINSLAIVSISKKISSQIKELTADKHPPIFEFLTIYPRFHFSQIPLPKFEKKPFIVLFVGNLVENKGIFDLIQIANLLKKKEVDNFQFHICGKGPDESLLKKRIDIESLKDCFFLHGYCTQNKLKEMFAFSHVFIVPTKKTFIEGLPNVIFESILAGRPVITSSVCPAIDYVMPAVVEVSPENIEEYAQALHQLYNDKAFFEAKCKACVGLKDPFFDMNNSWKEGIRRALEETHAHSE
jgi:glycogen(starch) synthase